LERQIMPRPATFQPDAVIERAMLLFWEKGYAETSVRDLVEGTAVLRGSLYHAFGDKRSLYIQALRRYGALALRQLTEAWDSAAPVRDNVRMVLMAIVDLPEAERRRGSMVCNCMVEVAPHDAEVAGVVAEILLEFTRFFQAAFAAGQRAGEPAAGTSPRALAHYLVSSIQGLCVTAKAGAPRTELLDVVEVTLAAWP
jgi:TetR/AcrR family transcriptional repressor of nem operon